MLNKKAQATSWSLKEFGTLVLRFLAVMVLIYFIVGMVSIFTKPRAVGNAYQDLERVVSEIEDLQQGERIIVPILSVDHSMIIRSMEVAERTSLNCKKGEGNYCACLQNEQGEILTCKSIEVDSQIRRTDAEFLPGRGIFIERTENYIEVREA